jgi:hypothetical protein
MTPNFPAKPGMATKLQRSLSPTLSTIQLHGMHCGQSARDLGMAISMARYTLRMKYPLKDGIPSIKVNLRP